MSSREPFPVKLYALLELAEARGLGGAGCSWLPHGRAFKIVDKRKFMEIDVPMFFNQTKLRSFYRQLYLWGFKRISAGDDEGAYYHEFFHRNAPVDLTRIVRSSIKGETKRDDIKDRTDPDFYSMPPRPISRPRLPANPLGDSSSHASVPSRDSRDCRGPLDLGTSRREDNGIPGFVSPMCSFAIRKLAERVSVPTARHLPANVLPNANVNKMSEAFSGVVKSWLSSDLALLEPLPYNPHEAPSTNTAPLDDEVDGSGASTVEPVSHDDMDIKCDEFANLIDDRIHLVGVDNDDSDISPIGGNTLPSIGNFHSACMGGTHINERCLELAIHHQDMK
ncbi:hypothetical protein ACHAWF_003622 [Thalassiosira exigua]